MRREFIMKSVPTPTAVVEQMKKFLYAAKIRTPLMVSFDITRHCNLSCRHCYNKNQAPMDYLDSVEKVNIIADKLLEMQVYEVTLSGGEPLLSPYFMHFVTACKERNLCLRIITNGILLDKYYHALSQTLTDMDTIQFSIDESLHSWNGQRYASYNEKERAYNNLRTIVGVFKNVVVNITPTKLNQSDILNLVEDVVNCGVRYISATPYIPMGGITAESTVPDYSLLWKVEQDVAAFCSLKNVTYFGGISGHACQQLSLLDNDYSGFSDKTSPSIVLKHRYCDAGNFSFHISNDGRIFPCVFMQFEDFIISHIEKESVNILNDFNSFQKLANINLPSKCSDCARLSDCCGGCMGLIYDHYKSLEYIDPRCTL